MTKEETGHSRRDFLKLAGTATPALVAAATLAPDAAEAAEVDMGVGLRKTEHVRKYLASARF
jgi:hypothetical protein